jgi:aspartyl-tRNA(Asn)/glutamyl-tRNA(Gln) amidotransferase subunit C
MSQSPHIDIDYVANLARIELSDAEKARLGSQLDDILGYFEKLNAVNVEGIEPMAHTQKVHNVWREGDAAWADLFRCGPSGHGTRAARQSSRCP